MAARKPVVIRGDNLFGEMPAGDTVHASALSAALAALDPLTPSANKLLRYTSGTTAELIDIVAVANGGTGASTLTGYVKGNGAGAFTASASIPNTDISGLGTMATQNATAVAITGGTISGVTSLDVTGTAAPLATLNRTGSAVNTALAFQNTSGTVYVGHGAANTFAIDGDANISNLPWFQCASSGINATAIGAATPSTGAFTTGAFSGAVSLGTSAANAITVNGRPTLNDTILRWAGTALSILPTTSDGADTGEFYLDGGGAASASRGAWIGIYGNENASRPGDLRLHAGNVSGGAVTIAAGADVDVAAFTTTGLAVTGAISATGQITAASAVRSTGAVATLAANQAGMDFVSGAGRSYALGADNATIGTYRIAVFSANASIGGTRLEVSSTGAAVTGAVSATTTITAGTTVTAAKSLLVSDVYQLTDVASAAETRTIDLANGAVQTLSANQTFTLTYAGPAGSAGSFWLFVWNPSGSSFTVSTPRAPSASVQCTSNKTTLIHGFWDGTQGWVITGTPFGNSDIRPT